MLLEFENISMRIGPIIIGTNNFSLFFRKNEFKKWLKLLFSFIWKIVTLLLAILKTKLHYRSN